VNRLLERFRLHSSIISRFLYFTFLILLALSFDAGIPTAVQGQTNPQNNPSSVRCPSPANPSRLYFECVGQPFDSIEETLTKDWAGFRTELNMLGITPTASYTTQLMGDPSGGQARGFTYSGNLQVSINWDLHKLLRVPGLSFNVGAAWSTGKNLSADYVGNSFTVQSAYTAPGSGTNNLTLGELYLRQRLLNNSLVLAGGRMAPASTFATMPVLSNYVNAGINPAPLALGINDTTFTSYPPGVEWGAQAIYNIAPVLQIAAGVFNTNQSSARGANGGLDFALQQGNRGVLSVVQINYLLNHAPADRGLPGQYALGGFYNSNRFNSLGNSSAESGNYSIYGMFQQMVYREGGSGSQKGLTVWGESALAPKSSVNTMPYFVGAGLSYQGLIPGRGDDIVSAGIIYGTFSRSIPRTTGETMIEVNYQIALNRWLSITPDIQYVIRPGGSSAVGNAFVLGAQATINF
jgi:porin